jgi:hypothetical protein
LKIQKKSADNVLLPEGCSNECPEPGLLAAWLEAGQLAAAELHQVPALQARLQFHCSNNTAGQWREPGLRIRIRIGSGFNWVSGLDSIGSVNPELDLESRSGSRKAKMTHKSRKKLKKFMF